MTLQVIRASRPLSPWMEETLAIEKKGNMESAIKSRLQSVQFGEPQIYKGIVIVPLISPADGALQ
jgi:hypothetical protein